MISIERIKRMELEIQVPPSKAHTLRSLILGALATGTTRIYNPLLGEDQLHLIECLKALGVEIIHDDKGITVTGSSGSFDPISDTLNCGESGVAMNFLSAVSCLAKRPVTLTGKEGLLKRPVNEVIQGVRQLGGKIDFLEREGFPPLRVHPEGLKGGNALMSGEKTSQYFSSLAIAAACAREDVTIACSDEMSEKPYFDITLEMMELFGVKATNDHYRTITVKSGQHYQATKIAIESDYSSASYFFAAAAITGAKIFLRGLTENSVQGDRRIVEYARSMGCAVDFVSDGIMVTGGKIKPIDAVFSDTPDLVPTVAVMAAFAQGPSTLRDVAHLKFKECDRISAIIDGLSRMGIKAGISGKDLIIEGNPHGIRGADIASLNDHRIAMSFAIAGLTLDGQTIDDGSCVRKSYPNFWETFDAFVR